MSPAVFVLDNPIQNYAWGSRTAIAELLGRPSPSPQPEAELWIGAHPKAHSRIAEPHGKGTLDQAIQDDPVALLGSEVCDRFGNELPFLFKVLAAGEPLSIQAHPNQEQARGGWARENAEGIPLDAPRRNYRDLNHKPELLCALTPFTALKGFRPYEDVAQGLSPIARPELGPETSRLSREGTPQALRALFARLMTLEADERAPLLKRAAAEAARRAKDPAWQWVAKLLETHPDDASVLAPLYLNLVTLDPGEGMFLPAGELHAYLSSGAMIAAESADPPAWTKDAAKVTTPFVSVPGLLTGQCVSKDGFDYLSVRINADPNDARTDDIAGDVKVGPIVLKDWGLHLIDVNLAMGNLVDLVGTQSQAYLARK